MDDQVGPAHKNRETWIEERREQPKEQEIIDDQEGVMSHGVPFSPQCTEFTMVGRRAKQTNAAADSGQEEENNGCKDGARKGKRKKEKRQQDSKPNCFLQHVQACEAEQANAKCGHKSKV